MLEGCFDDRKWKTHIAGKSISSKRKSLKPKETLNCINIMLPRDRDEELQRSTAISLRLEKPPYP